MPHLPNGGFQAASHGSERRADFDLLRRVHELEHLTMDQAAELTALDARLDALETQTDAIGASVPYTPVVSGTGWAQGAGSQSGFYAVIGQIVVFEAILVFGAGATFGAGTAHLSLPPPTPIGTTSRIEATFNDVAGGAGVHVGQGIIVPTNRVELRRVTVTGTTVVTSVAVNNTNPFTWAVGDAMTMAGWYVTT